MIGLILGTSEGKNIVGGLNRFTDNILISTATTYGGELFNEYKYKFLNTKPLSFDELGQMFLKNNISVLVDASHPYAVEISCNCEKLCEKLNVKYLRYERASVCDKYKNKDKVIFVKDYKELIDKIKSIKELHNKNATILNTTGSKNVDKFICSGILNRIVHRILPSVEVMKQCFKLGINTEDIIAIKGPIGYKLNLGFIEQYNAKAIILKDSGIQGGTEEKIEAALYKDIYAFIIERKKKVYQNIFYNEEEVVKYIKNKKLY
ncbi:cobalt-precorrin-6A reductase [Clostridium sp. WILCCON 0269]|uniref:Cobalt-precorrin-6A reductase n=1 Tax=Candidatus Clostridium eludens TaxID=3381663 RepID=A0ABW8SG31_9CLOT